MGLQHGQPTLVSLVRNVDIVAAYLFDTLIFANTFSALSVTGGLLVVMATVGSGMVDLATSQRGEEGEYDKLGQSSRALVYNSSD